MDPFSFRVPARFHLSDFTKYEFNPYIPISGCCNGSRIRLNVAVHEFESLIFGDVPLRLAEAIPESCGWWVRDAPRGDSFRKQVAVRDFWNFPSDCPSHWGLLPGSDLQSTSMGVPVWKKNHLLSLPKELRLEIWKWTLTDPSVPDLVVYIGRDRTAAHLKKLVPRVLTWLQPGRDCPIGLGILGTNRFIYEEALPLLYHSVRFAPADHQGMFPLFLDSLSPYARSLIRHLKLHVPRQIYNIDMFGDPAVPLFHWAVTCAQVAKLDGQLRDVEVEGCWTDSGSITRRTRRSILYPLCKIKTKKIFGANNDTGMDHLVEEANKELIAKTALRRLEAERNAALPAPTEGLQEDEHEEGKRETDQYLNRPLVAARYYSALFSVTHDVTISGDLNAIPGIVAFERELEESTRGMDDGEGSPTDDAGMLMEDWDVVSYRSGISTPRGRPPSYASRRSSSSWTDAASTIAELADLLNDRNA